jgi:hypothetical protein
VPQLRRHDYREGAEEEIPPARPAALNAAAIWMIIAVVRPPLVVVAAIAGLTKPDGRPLAER